MLKEMSDDPQKRITAINSVVQSIAHIPDSVSRDVYVQECSLLMNVPDNTIAKAVAKARHAIVDQMKRERERRLYSDNKPNTQTSTKIPQTVQDTTTDISNENSPVESSLKNLNDTHLNDFQSQSINTRVSIDKTLRESDYPLYPLEKSVIKYCLRYAFLNFCTYEAPVDETESDQKVQLVNLDVLQFIKEELRESNLQFSVPIFNTMFEMLDAMRPEFEKYLEEKLIVIDRSLADYRRKEYEEIGSSAMSMEQIQREEKRIEKEIAHKRDINIKEIIKEFPARKLGSDENAQIRKLALELVMDKHHLSNIYLKDGNTEAEEDKLSVLLVRALDEWKNEIINIRIKELFKRFHEASVAGDTLLQTELQTELNSLMTIRKEMSKYIGERTVCNR